MAHQNARRDPDSFYVENKMDLSEIEGALNQLDDAINHLSWHVLSIHNDTNSAFQALVEEGRSLFATLANGIGPEK